ncbi:MAG: DUF1638 domain-containing protein [Verrucomicrobiota bacterium]
MKTLKSLSSPCNQPRLALLACSVFKQEIELYTRGASHIKETRFFEMSLHDRPTYLRGILQENLESIEARTDIDAVVLAYGLCGRGTLGLRPTRHPFVIPRAHDCITVFFGSKEIYAKHQQGCPTCYYYTPGWNRGRRVPGEERLEAMRLELAAKFEPEEVDFLLTSEREQWAKYDTATYLDLGTTDAQDESEFARKCAAWLGWKFEHYHGDPTLLRDLLWGNWDADRFQIIAPEMQLGQTLDDSIMSAERASSRVPRS